MLFPLFSFSSLLLGSLAMDAHGVVCFHLSSLGVVFMLCAAVAHVVGWFSPYRFLAPPHAPVSRLCFESSPDVYSKPGRGRKTGSCASEEMHGRSTHASHGSRLRTWLELSGESAFRSSEIFFNSGGMSHSRPRTTRQVKGERFPVSDDSLP